MHLRLSNVVEGLCITLQGSQNQTQPPVFLWQLFCRRYRDIPFLNLASTFHQARRHKEAAIILHAAVDHAPTQPLHYYALGNVYTVLAEYNRSLACYNNILKLQPSMQEAATLRHAILCHQKLEKELLELHE